MNKFTKYIIEKFNLRLTTGGIRRLKLPKEEAVLHARAERIKRAPHVVPTLNQILLRVVRDQLDLLNTLPLRPMIIDGALRYKLARIEYQCATGVPIDIILAYINRAISDGSELVFISQTAALNIYHLKQLLKMYRLYSSDHCRAGWHYTDFN